MTITSVARGSRDITMYNSLCTVFSQKRLETYLNAANQDKKQALELYKLNLRLSEALYPMLCIFEITLRNRISTVLVKNYGDKWFDGHEENWFDGKIYGERKKEEKGDYNYELDELQKTLKKLSGKGKQVTSDVLIAELNFGFWTGMVCKTIYEKQLWQKHISKVFIDAPERFNLIGNIKDIRRELGEIHKLRNRVFHYEPIFCPKDFSYYKLIFNYNNGKKLLGWLSKDALYLLDGQDQFSGLIDSIPANMKRCPPPLPRKKPR